MSIIVRSRPDEVQTGLVGIGARNEARIGYTGADVIGEATRDIQQGLGAFAQVAEKERQKSDVASYQEAQRKLDGWEENWNDPNNAKGFYSYKGRDALGLKDAMVPDFDKTTGEIASRLSPRAKEQFDAYAASRRHDIATRANTYATNQYDGWRKANSDAWETGQVNNVVRAYQDGDEDQAIKLLGQTMQTMAAEAVAEGRPATELSVRQAALTSNVHQSILSGMLVADPLKARAYFEAHKDELLPNDRTVMEAKVQVYGDDAEADAVVQDHASGQVQVAMSRGDHAAVQATLGSLGDQYGFTTTSTTRTPEENAKVGGVANSQHLTGTARDFSVKGKSPAQIEAFATELRAQGFEVITRNHGTGPHVHAELPPGSKVSERPPPATLGELVAAVRADPRMDTPAKRKAAEIKARNEWSLREADDADRKSAALERAHTAIETADPSLPLRQILGDDYMAMAAGGHIPALESRQGERRAGVGESSDPTTLAAMEEGIYRAAVGGEAARAGLRAIEPFDPSIRLAMADRKRLATAKQAVLSGDEKRTEKAVSDGEMSGLIVQYRLTNLGLTADVIKKNPAKRDQAIAFEQSMRSWRSKFAKDNGRDPTYVEARKQADTLTLSALKFDVPGRVWGTNSETVADLRIPPADQALIVDALQQEGSPVTGETVAAKWKAYVHRQEAK